VKRAARLIALAGAVGLGLFLFRAVPRDVVLVYALGERRLRSLEVEIVRGAEVIRRAELRPPAGPAGALRHPVRLTDGEYLLRLRIGPADGPPARVELPITVSESTTIVLPLDAPR
jgi:hypothetical protein